MWDFFKHKILSARSECNPTTVILGQLVMLQQNYDPQIPVTWIRGQPQIDTVSQYVDTVSQFVDTVSQFVDTVNAIC